MPQDNTDATSAAPTYDAWGDLRVLVAIPVYNEERYIDRVLSRVLQYTKDVLVIDDGSTDRTPQMLAQHPVYVLRHPTNMGYGRALRDAFTFAEGHGYDWIITMDCDEQHEPASIPAFIRAAAADNADIISGSRYIASMDESTEPPADRRAINVALTTELNDRLDWSLTDSFCGFKAHRVSSLASLRLTETGYAFPMQFWVQCAALGLRVREIPVKLIYLDHTRQFGNGLDNPHVRLAHYRQVLHAELCRQAHRLPEHALAQLTTPCGGCGDKR
ncbi:MAG: glycosyltransferase family 2 protein [Phycisphaerales bacterium]|nr:glycosyltransferase family 2 protein [Phycisphaerales bacterium]